MASISPSSSDLARAALEAFRRNDRTKARACLDQVYRIDMNGAPWLLIAQIEQALDDDAAARAALLRHIAIAPRDLPALLLLGASHVRSGEDRVATRFYRTALAVAAQPGVTAPASLGPMLEEAQRFLTTANANFAAHLENAVRTAGLGHGQPGLRIRAALDLLMGRSEVYLQQPSMFYFPGLPQRAFFERDEFDWLPAVEAAVPEMRRELDMLLAGADGFAPYVHRTPDQPPPANPLLDDPSWSAQYLWRGGERVEPAASACPATMAALEVAPVPHITGRSPMALFSLLRPGTHIQPHHGLLNTRLICHIPLIAPPDCAIRVGAETRSWHEGEALIFDDSFEHEAWNRGISHRVVLLFEIWRPEISPDERAALTGIFEAIDTYRGVAVDKG